MHREETKLVLGRGEVFFDRFAPGTRVGEGELYLGNTKTFQIQRDIERMARVRSYRGRKVEREGSVISESHAVNFTTDHIDMNNVALWFGSDERDSLVISQSAQQENFVFRHGRYYQLGKTFFPGIGVRNVDFVRVFVSGLVVPEQGNYELDKELGRIGVLKNAPSIPDGASVTVSFEWRNGKVLNAQSEAEEIYGSMRFIGYNPYGPVKNFVFPMVRLAPRGLVDLKGDEFQQWQFTANAMNLGPNIKQLYVDEYVLDGFTADEQAILNEFGSFEPFPFWENELHQSTNFDWPPAVIFQGV